MALLLGLGALVACGGSTVDDPGAGSGSASASGTVAGTTLQVASQLAFFEPVTASESCSGSSDGGTSCTTSSSGQAAVVLLTNRVDATCAAVQSAIASNANTAFGSMATLELVAANGTGQLSAGTYALGSGGGSGAIAQFSTTTASCGKGLDLTASGGTITLTQVDATRVTGTYRVDFYAQGTFSGSFDVPICDLPDASASSSSGPVVCKP